MLKIFKYQGIIQVTCELPFRIRFTQQLVNRFWCLFHTNVIPRSVIFSITYLTPTPRMLAHIVVSKCIKFSESTADRRPTSVI